MEAEPAPESQRGWGTEGALGVSQHTRGSLHLDLAPWFHLSPQWMGLAPWSLKEKTRGENKWVGGVDGKAHWPELDSDKLGGDEALC